MSGSAKKVFVKTFGCQMNVYDSDRMVELMAPLGYVAVSDPGIADVVILNTCHIREKAAEKVYSELGRLKPLKRRPAAAGGPVLIGVAGCVAQAEGEEILRRAPFVDLVVGPQSYHRLPDLLSRASATAASVLDIEFPPEPKFDTLRLPELSAGGVSALLTVQEGCDKFCSFCVVPYTRGVEYSRPAADILREARALEARGAREITLLGQNVNAYHGEAPDGGEWSLARLIAEIAELSGIARIRYTTSHPVDMDDDLIAAHATNEKLMPFVHLPVQSGSDRILTAMRRRYRRDDYRRVVERLRGARPDIALGSDFIVGYPGESDADFAQTIDLVAEVGFAQAFSFRYSPRPGTPAATAPPVDALVAKQRLIALQDLLGRQQKAFNDACVGRVLPVLFEDEGRPAGQVFGRTPYLQAVHVELPASRIGAVMSIRITQAHHGGLSGTADEGAFA